MELDFTEEELRLLKRAVLEDCNRLDADDLNRANQMEKVADSVLVKLQDALDEITRKTQ
jgi:hypothetical protein